MDEDSIRSMPTVVKVKLISNWYGCSKTVAQLCYYQSGVPWPIPLDDPAGFIGPQCLAAVEDQNGDWYIPAGWICNVARPQDAFDGHYELVIAGPGCAGSSSSSGTSSTCNTNPTPRADAPTLTDWDQVWGRKMTNGVWCYGWIDDDACASSSGS